MPTTFSCPDEYRDKVERAVLEDTKLRVGKMGRLGAEHVPTGALNLLALLELGEADQAAVKKMCKGNDSLGVIAAAAQWCGINNADIAAAARASGRYDWDDLKRVLGVRNVIELMGNTLGDWVAALVTSSDRTFTLRELVQEYGPAEVQQEMGRFQVEDIMSSLEGRLSLDEILQVLQPAQRREVLRTRLHQALEHHLEEARHAQKRFCGAQP